MAATTKRRPASKAKARPRKKPAPRKKASNDTMTWLKDRGSQFLGLFASLLAVLAIAKVGLVGKFIANMVRLIVGG